MNYPMIDAHIHLDLYSETEQEVILNDLSSYNIHYLISVSNHLQSAKANLVLANQSDKVKPAFGFHPEQVLPTEFEIIDLLKFIKQHQAEMIAVGEVGLPYYLRQEDDSVQPKAYEELLEVFIKQAAELNKPIILHAVYEDAPIVVDLLETHSIKKAHFHWFKGDTKTVERLIQNDYFISITPDVLYEKEIQGLIRRYPLSLLMIETDGPWPFEKQFKDKMTHPKMIHDIVKKIASIKQMNEQDVAATLFTNTTNFYNLV